MRIKRLLIDLSEGCNLRCKMCHLNINKDIKKEEHKSISIKHLNKILEEIKDDNPLIQPALYSEPLLNPGFKESIFLMKNKGFKVALNTNGTLADDNMLNFFIESGIDSVNFSLDAHSGKNYNFIKGVDKYESVKKSVFSLLQKRGKGKFPRIGVSFVRQDSNLHEEKDFIEFWKKHVDVIRVNALFCYDGKVKYKLSRIRQKRVPCKLLFETLAVRANGDAVLCCADFLGEYKMGNIIENSVESVWKGKKFKQARHWNANNMWDQIPKCEKCEISEQEYKEEIRGKYLIRKSSVMGYYNAIDKLDNWSGSLLGGHKVKFNKNE